MDLFKLLLSKPAYLYIARSQGFEPEQFMYELDPQKYTRFIMGPTYDQLSTDWLVSKDIDIDPRKMKDPFEYLTYIVKRSTFGAINEYWQKCSVNQDCHDLFIGALVDVNISMFVPEMVIDNLATYPPSPLLWGLLARTVDAEISDSYNDGREHYSLFYKAWPSEVQWLLQLRTVQYQLDMAPPLFDEYGITGIDALVAVGTTFKQDWDTHQNNVVLDISAIEYN